MKYYFILTVNYTICFINCFLIVRGEWNYNAGSTLKGSDSSAKCETDVVQVPSHQFIWEYQNQGSSKGNICLHNVTNKVVIRKCDPVTRKWSSSTVTCAVVQQQANTFCPEDLIEISVRDKHICLRISERPQPKQQADSFCYGSDTLAAAETLNADEAQSLKNALQERNIYKYWLPVTRAGGDQVEPFVVRLPGKNWGDIFDMPLSAEDLLSSDFCLAAAFDNNSRLLRTEVTACNKSLHIVCVYKKKFVAFSGCPQGFAAMSYTPNECYGIQWQAALFPLELQPVSLVEYVAGRSRMRFIFEKIQIDPEEFFFVENIATEEGMCGLVMNSMESMRIVCTLDEVGNIPALSKEILSNRKDVEMVLHADLELQKLVLTVYNRNYIWRIDDSDDDNFGIKCFTDANYAIRKNVKIERIWENDLHTKTMFMLKLNGNGPAQYWCEAHTVFDFSLIESAKIVASKRQKGHIFAMSFDIACNGSIQQYCQHLFQSIKPLSKEIERLLNTRKTSREYRNQLEKLVIHDVRIMAVESVLKESPSTVRCLCHVTAALQFSAVDNSNEQSSEEQDSEENEQGVRHDAAVRMEVLKRLTRLMSYTRPQQAHTVRSTQFCFPETFVLSNGSVNQWQSVERGQVAITQKLCLQRNGLPVMRKCVGGFLQGAYWHQVSTDELKCVTEAQKQTITKDLFELNDSKSNKSYTATAIKHITNLLEDNLSNLIPADFYYIAKIMQTSMRTFFSYTAKGNITSIDNEVDVSSDILRIYNYLLEANEAVIRLSVTLNTTNILLAAFENIIDTVSFETTQKKDNNTSLFLQKNESIWESTDAVDKIVETVEYLDIGVRVKIATNFAIFTINPSVANITGVAIFSSDNDSDEELKQEFGALRGSFEHEYYRFLLGNQSVDDLLYESNLQLATYVPETLWHRLDEILLLAGNTAKSSRPQPMIIIKMYANDKLFQDLNATASRALRGQVLSVSIPGHNRDLPEMLPLILRVNSTAAGNNSEQSCSYWNYRSWANDGISFLGRSEIDDDLILCGCTHLTPFAYLIGVRDTVSVDSEVIIQTRRHQYALDVITLLGCSLSLLGVVCIFVTAITFQTWRKKASSRVLLHLSTAIALQMILFCFVNTEENSYKLIESGILSSCIAIGACMHYSVLVQFCWMVIIAYLQFKRYVKIFESNRTSKFFITSAFIGWGLPLLPVSLVLIFDRKSYIPDENSMNTNNCYPTGYSLFFGIILPITLIIAINFIIYLIVMYNILKGPDRSLRHTEKRLVMSQLRLSVLLYFLLGFTWIFGLLATMKMGLVFSYLFCLTATLQGFVLFVYFIILDPITRRMWSRHFSGYLH